MRAFRAKHYKKIRTRHWQSSFFQSKKISEAPRSGENFHMLELVKYMKHFKDGYLRHKYLWSSSQLKMQKKFTDGKLQKYFSELCQNVWACNNNRGSTAHIRKEMVLFSVQRNSQEISSVLQIEIHEPCTWKHRKFINLNSDMYKTMWWEKQYNNQWQKESWAHEDKWMQFSA